MRVLLVAKSAGFCFGVSRSVKMAEEMLAAEANCYSLGELIHNDDVVQHLRSEGLTVADGPEQIPQARRSSSDPTASAVRSLRPCSARARRCMTQPAQRSSASMRSWAEASAEGRQPVIIGAADHPGGACDLRLVHIPNCGQ